MSITGKTYETGNNASANPAFRDKMFQNGILKQQFMESSDQGSYIGPKVPQNNAEVLAAIQKDRPHSPARHYKIIENILMKDMSVCLLKMY